MAAAPDFNTPLRIIRQGMKNAGLLQDGDDPSGELLMDCMNRLNDIVNLWQTQGIKLWLNKMRTITLVAGTATYTLGPAGTGIRQMRVLEGYYRDVNNIDRPLDMLSWNDYNALSNKTQQGVVTGFFVDKQALNTAVTMWLVPDATAALGTVRLLVQDPVTNVISLTEAMNFPNEWYMALHWGLADEICTGQPAGIIQRCAQRAKMYREALEDWDVEDASTSFAPDHRGGQPSAFR